MVVGGGALSPQDLRSQIDASALRECQAYTTAPNSPLEALLANFAENMEKAGKCRERHNNLVKIIKQRQAGYADQN